MAREPKLHEIAKTDEEIAGLYFPQYKSDVSVEEIRKELASNIQLSSAFMRMSDDERTKLLADLALKIAQGKREQ
jgi:hypothetical protein